MQNSLSPHMLSQEQSQNTLLQEHTSQIQDILSNTLFSPEAKELIETYGGKAASLVWQLQHGNERFLIPFSVLKVDEDMSLEYQKRSWKEFFRGSANGDEIGLVGIIESMKGHGLLDEVREIIIDSESKRVKDYAHYFDGNSHYTGVSSIIVSPYIDAHHFNYRHTFGSIIVHPDFDDMYLINTYGGRAQALVDGNGNILKMLGFQESISFIRPYIKEIIEMKHATDSVGFIQNSTSQTEFAIIGEQIKEQLKQTSGYQYMPKTSGNIVFLQQRVFRKPSTTKREIKELEYDYDMNQFGDQSVFKQGYLKIDYLKAKEYLKENPDNSKIILHVNEKNYFTLKSHKESFGVLRHPRVAGVLISPGQSHGLGSLEHDTYRLLQHSLPVRVAHI